MTTLVEKIIVKNDTKLWEKIEQIKNELFKYKNDSKSYIEKLTTENDQLKNKLSKYENDSKSSIEKLKVENDQLKTSLSNKITECNNLYAMGEIIYSRKYEILLSRESFNAGYMFTLIGRELLREMKNNVMKHIIDHCSDLNEEVLVDEYFTSTRLIQLFCRTANEELIRYIIDKGVELECPDKKGYYPLHLICKYCTCSMIKYIISKGVNTKSNPEIDLIQIINKRSFTSDEKAELISLI